MDDVEQSGHWPENQRKVWLSTLAKTPLACLPRKVRPIAILPSTYRIWAKARFQQLKPWLEHVLAPCVYAYRPQRDALQVGVELARALEQAKHRALQQPYGWMIASLDCTKAFPSIPRSYLWRILRRMQCPERLVATMEQYYKVTQATWRLRDRIVSRFCWTPLKGVYQGCPISVALFNCLLLPLALRLQEETPEVIPRFYADDITLSSNNAEQLTAALQLCKEYLEMLNMELNPTKTQVLSIGPAPDSIVVDGQHIRKQDVITVVGTHLYATGDATGSEKIAKDENVLYPALRTLATLPMTIANKDRVLNQIVAARWRYGCWHAIPEKGHLKAWRTAQLATVTVAMTKGCRSTTLYHALAFKPHKVDPVMARLWELTRLLGRSEDWWDELSYYLNTEHPPLGPVSCCAYILRQMGFMPDTKWCLRDHIGTIHLRKPREEAQVSGWAHAWRIRMRNYLVGRHTSDRPQWLHASRHIVGQDVAIQVEWQ